jgi:hypothetical protein
LVLVRLERGRQPLAGWVAGALLLAAVVAGRPARAQDESEAPSRDAAPAAPEPTGAPEPSVLETYYPPAVAGPGLRLPVSPTRLYLDGAYGVVSDLSALPYITGQARNGRFAAGGAYRWKGFSFEGEIPFLNVTRIDVETVFNMAAVPADAHQTQVSFGDASVGAIWSTPLVGPDTLVAGVALRTRLATHSTRFDFHLADGSLATMAIPYYFHVEPTLVLGGALGRFVFVVNEGAIAFVGPDGDFADMHLTVPTVLFWDAHYAASFSPWPFLGASVELATQIQLNHVGDQMEMLNGQDFSKFNHLHAAWVAPALQLHFGQTRVDLIARIGLTRGQEVYGVLEYVGTSSYTLRVTRAFN